MVLIIYSYVEKPGWIGSSGKQFWDYLDLLIVPAALALGVYWLNRRETERQDRAQAERELERQKLEARREHERAQDAALQAYLDKMGLLLLDKDRPLQRAQVGDRLSTLARARTLTVLKTLDGNRKGTVVQFLYESGLARRGAYIVRLGGSEQTGAITGGQFPLFPSQSAADLSGSTQKRRNPPPPADPTNVRLGERSCGQRCYR